MRPAAEQDETMEVEVRAAARTFDDLVDINAPTATAHVPPSAARLRIASASLPIRCEQLGRTMADGAVSRGYCRNGRRLGARRRCIGQSWGFAARAKSGYVIPRFERARMHCSSRLVAMALSGLSQSIGASRADITYRE
jgi:hypothetical protein